MFRQLAASSCARRFSTAPPKSNIELVKKLRAVTNAPIVKARQALTESNYDFDGALTWLENDMASDGAAKFEKLKGRTASQGLISTSIVHGGYKSRVGSGEGAVQAGIVELNCESDFVARTDEFAKTARDIAHAVAHLSSAKGTAGFTAANIDELMEQPMSSDSTDTVKSVLTDLIGRTRENVTLRRASSIWVPESPSSHILRLGSYVHNAMSGFPTQGRIASLALCRLSRFPTGDTLSSILEATETMERALARQIVGLETRFIHEVAGEPEETALYKQQFALLGGPGSDLLVSEVLQKWGEKYGVTLDVADFQRWEVGQAS